MAQLAVLLAGLLLAESQASDLEVRSEHQGRGRDTIFLSKYLSSEPDTSKSSMIDYDQMIIPQIHQVKHGSGFMVIDDKPVLHPLKQMQASAAFTPVSGFDSPNIVDIDEKQAEQNLLVNDNKNPIILSAIGIGLVSLVTMLGFRMQRRLQPATFHASSDRIGLDMPMNTVSTLGDNAMEMKFKDRSAAVKSSRVGWERLSSQSSHPLTVCYGTAPDKQSGSWSMARHMPAQSSSSSSFFDSVVFNPRDFEGHAKFFREAEHKHGRIAIFAALGYPSAEHFQPLLGRGIDVPPYVVSQQTPLETYWHRVILAIGMIETLSLAKGTHKTPMADCILGDFEWDPAEMKTMGINNAHLALDRIAAVRRSAGCALLAVAAPFYGIPSALAASVSNLGNIPQNVEGAVIGIEEDAPFRSSLKQIRALLDTLGVEGTVTKMRAPEDDGPIIQRPYQVGLLPGTDRLMTCPANTKCLSGTRGEKKYIPPFVFFDQKGDAVGNLLELLYSAADASVLTAKGNFFNGAGVYVLTEVYDEDTVFDVEFQFLPGVLENIVEARILARENAKSTSEAREKELLGVFGKALGWLPLDNNAYRIPGLTDDERGIITTSALELKYREQFEGQMEQADARVREQMERDRKKIEELKKTISDLLDSIDRQEVDRYYEYLDLRSKSAQIREEYEAGVNRRIGGVANDGRYAASQKIQMGNSFSGLINSKDDVTAKIYQNATIGATTEDDAPPPPKKNLFEKVRGKR